MSSLPTELATARLTLRRLRSGDERSVYELLSDMLVIRYMLFPRFTMQQAESFVVRFSTEPSNDGPRQVLFGITLGETSDLVGLCGLVLDAELPTAEAWYLLSPEHWFRQEGFHRANLLIHGEWRDSHTYAMLESEWSAGGSA